MMSHDVMILSCDVMECRVSDHVMHPVQGALVRSSRWGSLAALAVRVW